MPADQIDFRFVAIDDGKNDDATYWPVTDSFGAITAESGDGSASLRFKTTGISVAQRTADTDWQPMILGPAVVANVILTDTRLALVCGRFNKGPGYGEILYLPVTDREEPVGGRPPYPRLVGQVRHESVTWLRFRRKRGMLSNNELEVGIVTTAPRLGLVARKLALWLKRGTDPQNLADEWGQRVRRARLATSDLADDVRQEIEASRFTATGEGWSVMRFPGYADVE